MSGDDRSDSPADGVIDLVRFFRALRPEARREYEALAALDREFGEDVARERRVLAERRGGTEGGGAEGAK
jgi:hypothetical protein